MRCRQLAKQRAKRAAAAQQLPGECKGVGDTACRRGADRTAAAPMMATNGRWLARCDECAHEWTDLAKATKVRCLPVLPCQSMLVSPVCCAAACLPE